MENEALTLLWVRRNLSFQDSEWQCYSNRIFLCILYDKWSMDHSVMAWNTQICG